MRAWFLAVVLAVTGSAAADPYVPIDDGEVLQTLPRVLFYARDHLDDLRTKLAQNPTDADVAVRLASNYMQIAKRENDPRYYGYARAAIDPWWPPGSAPAPGSVSATAPPVPTEVLRLRAKLKERDHEYDAALADQRLLLERAPTDAQAWVEVSNIEWVRGNYVEARAACERLSAVAAPLPSAICRTQIQSVTGQAPEAYDALGALLPSARESGLMEVVQYVFTQRAVIAEALGWHEKAEENFRAGLVNDAGDQYLMRAYADFLLDRGRDGEVVSLVREQVADVGLLLRGAIAARQAGDAVLADQWQARLARHFEEVRLRGSLPHGRYEARYTLVLLHDPARALELALANWEKQKQSRDSRNVLEAALAAGDAEAARPVIAFLRANNTQDVAMQRLVEQLEGVAHDTPK